MRSRPATGAEILLRASESAHDITRAERDNAVNALHDVMRTLQKSAGSPEENAVYARARAVLAQSGRANCAEAATLQAAYEEWAGRRGL